VPTFDTVEHTFDHWGVASSVARRLTVVPAERRDQVVDGLRAELSAGRVAPTLPTAEAFGGLLDGGLRKGCSYVVQGSTALTLALLTEASAAGSWAGMVGVQGAGIEAAARLGVELDRLVLVPEPGPRWLTVVGTLVDVLDLVVVRPPTPAYDAETRRLAARLREHGTVLLVQGDWPGAELRLSVTESRWYGLGEGHGHLSAREVTVTADGRGRQRTAKLWLPGGDGGIHLAEPAPTRTTDLTRWREERAG
jgi:hypothetical protein